VLVIQHGTRNNQWPANTVIEWSRLPIIGCFTDVHLLILYYNWKLGLIPFRPTLKGSRNHLHRFNFPCGILAVSIVMIKRGTLIYI